MWAVGAFWVTVFALGSTLALALATALCGAAIGALHWILRNR